MITTFKAKEKKHAYGMQVQMNSRNVQILFDESVAIERADLGMSPGSLHKS